MELAQEFCPSAELGLGLEGGLPTGVIREGWATDPVWSQGWVL